MKEIIPLYIIITALHKFRVLNAVEHHLLPDEKLSLAMKMGSLPDEGCRSWLVTAHPESPVSHHVGH